MPEETKDAPVEGAEGTTAPPTPEISPSSPPEGSVGPGFDAEALASQAAELAAQKLESLLDDRVDARFKSAKDKRFAKVDEIYDWVKKSGGDPAKIQSELTVSELQSRLDALEQGSDVGASAPASQEDFQAKTAEILNEGDVTIDDPLVAEWAGKAYATEAQALTDLQASIAKRAKQSGVTGAAAVGEAGKVAPAGDKTHDELAAELEKLQNEGSSPENMKRRREILAEMGTDMGSDKRSLF